PRLVKELRSVALRRGMHVGSGRCYEDFALPYLPFVEPFLAYLDQVPEAVQRTLGPDLEIVNGLLHRTETAAPLTSTALSTQPSQDTLRLFLAVSRVLIRLTRQQPLLLIIDDLHWTDRPSLDLLSHIVFAVADASEREPVPLFLIGTYRQVGPDERSARTIARLQR